MLKSRFIEPNSYSIENTLIELHLNKELNGLYGMQCCNYLIDPFDVYYSDYDHMKQLIDLFYPAVKYDLDNKKYVADYDLLGFKEGDADNYHIVLTPLDRFGNRDYSRPVVAFKDAQEFFTTVSDTYQEYLDDIS